MNFPLGGLGQIRLCREDEALREEETRGGLLMIATKAALAEQELLTARLHSESQRLGNLTIGMAGHLGYSFSSTTRHQAFAVSPAVFSRVQDPVQLGRISPCGY